LRYLSTLSSVTITVLTFDYILVLIVDPRNYLVDQFTVLIGICGVEVIVGVVRVNIREDLIMLGGASYHTVLQMHIQVLVVVVLVALISTAVVVVIVESLEATGLEESCFITVPYF